MIDAGSTDTKPPRDPSTEWQATGHLASPVHPPQLDAVRGARSFVRTRLEAVGLRDCADDAGLLVSELAANAVLHARTPFAVHLRPTLEGGVRVEVEDGSPLPPVLTPASTRAISGRGLDLVASVAARWGSHPSSDGGKVVWFEVEAGGAAPPMMDDTAELLALWGDEEPPVPLHRTEGLITSSMPAVGPTHEVVVPGLPVAALTAAEEAVDDLLRELQLLLLATPPGGTNLRAAGDGAPRRPPGEQEVAAALDAAARAFEPVRRQVRDQEATAAARGDALVTLRLELPASAARTAAAYREALDAARVQSRAGALLTGPEGLEGHTRVLRRYLDEVVRQSPATPAAQ